MQQGTKEVHIQDVPYQNLEHEIFRAAVGAGWTFKRVVTSDFREVLLSAVNAETTHMDILEYVKPPIDEGI